MRYQMLMKQLKLIQKQIELEEKQQKINECCNDEVSADISSTSEPDPTPEPVHEPDPTPPEPSTGGARVGPNVTSGKANWFGGTSWGD